MSEAWRPVVGYEGAYEVSDLGNVRSTARVTSAGVRLPGRPKATFLNMHGYPMVSLYLGNVGRQRRVHRLVLEAFVGPCPEGMEGCHSDGDPSNARLPNLRWDTKSENQFDRIRHGRHNHASKTHCSRGHAFEGANLRVTSRQRRCVACDQANERVRRSPGKNRPEDVGAIADRIYAAGRARE